MMSTDELTVTEQIIEELEQGAVPAELVGRYARSTVYSTAKRWRHGKAKPVASPNNDAAGLTYSKSLVIKGRIRIPTEPIMVQVDPRLRVLFDLNKAFFPEYDGDFSQWLYDRVKGYRTDQKRKPQLEASFQWVNGSPLREQASSEASIYDRAADAVAQSLESSPPKLPRITRHRNKCHSGDEDEDHS